MRKRSAVMAMLVASVFVVASPAAQAADAAAAGGKNSILGDHTVLMRGFDTTTPVTLQYHLAVDRQSGRVYLGTQRWRDCADDLDSCTANRTDGRGWTDPERVVLVKAPSGAFVLRSDSGLGQVELGKRGVKNAYFLGGIKVATKSSSSSPPSGASTCTGSCPPPSTANTTYTVPSNEITVEWVPPGS